MIKSSSDFSKNKRRESDSSINFAPEDEAGYYLGDRHEMGGHSFIEGISNEKDFAGVGPKGWSKSDEHIFEIVCEALSDDHFIDASDIVVEVEDGCVYLKGSVTNYKMKKTAQMSVENLPGVRDVMNLLIIDTSKSNP
jgi:osmotically-inducible protein OsmY